jgi:hypothetical protein
MQKRSLILWKRRVQYFRKSSHSRDQVPDRVERRGNQIFSMKILDKELALRVVHEERKGIIAVITFYPVERKRYGV